MRFDKRPKDLVTEGGVTLVAVALVGAVTVLFC